MDEGIMELDVLEHIFDGSVKPTGLKLSALQSITGNFSEERIIGTGGFATVYKVNFTFQSFSGLNNLNISRG
jgi:coatomer subunit beta'